MEPNEVEAHCSGHNTQHINAELWTPWSGPHGLKLNADATLFVKDGEAMMAMGFVVRNSIGGVALMDAKRMLHSSSMVSASDPDIISDFLAPANSTALDGNFFTFNFAVYSMLTIDRIQGTFNPPLIHRRCAELLSSLLMEALRLVLLTQLASFTPKLSRLRLSSCFLNGTSLTFRINLTMAVSGFGSANAGTVAIPSTVFATGIDDDILAKGFKTDFTSIQKIKAGLGAKAKN
ncbi:Uncharacterized protein TCM_030995 [Theobroma cacao]|uniref:Uncharacterized protein n=1 Tax=Theobroma cacao TaxID=3641 RepID=A0A061F6K1_THECC|nr:Uncharacterized protein TCM_030995 [Theobroma cacao]